MIFEVESEIRDFITTYRKDYLQRKSKKLATIRPYLNFIPPLNPLNAPFNEYLNFDEKNEQLPGEERFEDLRDNLQIEKSPNVTQDWVIPETIQRRSFRNPSQLAPRQLQQITQTKKHAGNLDPDLKERELLQVRTGESEYIAVIGRTGDRIMKEKNSGNPFPL